MTKSSSATDPAGSVAELIILDTEETSGRAISGTADDVISGRAKCGSAADYLSHGC